MIGKIFITRTGYDPQLGKQMAQMTLPSLRNRVLPIGLPTLR